MLQIALNAVRKIKIRVTHINSIRARLDKVIKIKANLGLITKFLRIKVRISLRSIKCNKACFMIPQIILTTEHLAWAKLMSISRGTRVSQTPAPTRHIT